MVVWIASREFVSSGVLTFASKLSRGFRLRSSPSPRCAPGFTFNNGFGAIKDSSAEYIIGTSGQSEGKTIGDISTTQISCPLTLAKVDNGMWAKLHNQWVGTATHDMAWVHHIYIGGVGITDTQYWLDSEATTAQI